MNPSVRVDPRPEAMGDVPGVCELPLTRAVVQYRDVHEMDGPGGRIEDIGLAVVVEGRYASSSESVDLGSGRMKVLDLSTELVVLDWIYEPTLEHVGELVRAAATSGEPNELERYCRSLGLRILERVGFGPLSRPTFLRIGFRDLCRDLDLHDGTSIRIVLGKGRLVRAHLDYDACALLFRTALHSPDAGLERSLAQAFPDAELRRVVPVMRTQPLAYQVRFALPETLDEAREALAQARRGLLHLVERYEPRRWASLQPVLETFGMRGTLSRLSPREPRVRAVRIAPAFTTSSAVH